MGAKTSCDCRNGDRAFQFEDLTAGQPLDCDACTADRAMGLISMAACIEGDEDVRSGIEELQDGSLYEGEFLGKERHGWGRITWASGDVFEGQFRQSFMHGQGTFNWADGSAYSGQWRENELGPAGHMKWSDGRQYRGRFISGRKHGEGHLVWPDGRSYAGQWSHDKQHGYGFVSEKRGRLQLSQWDDGVLSRWLSDASLAELAPDERCRAALCSGTVKLLSATWLVDQPHGFVIACGHDLPQDAFISPELAENLLEKRYGIVVVSYPWLTKSHPDPAGFHLRTLINYLGKHLEFFDGFDDVGVFWDFASLHRSGTHHEPRSEDEQQLRRIGLQSLGFLYGSKKTLVVKLTRVPKSEAGRHPYSSRGWCFAEAALGGFTKDSDQLLDLGLAAKAVDDRRVGWEELRDAAFSARPAPMSPEDMALALESLAFSNGDDRELVLDLYTTFFKEVAPALMVLALAHSRTEGGWGDTEVKLLCRALPSFVSCKALSLANHAHMSKASLKDLRARLQALPKLQRLVLPHHLMESKEALALINEWSSSGKNPANLLWLRTAERRVGRAGVAGQGEAA